jgi:hypothetical protein
MAVHRRIADELPAGEPCLRCGARLDAATGLSSASPPKEGDISICWYCAHLAAFTADGSLRPLTEAERVQVIVDVEVQKAVTAVLARQGLLKRPGAPWSPRRST